MKRLSDIWQLVAMMLIGILLFPAIALASDVSNAKWVGTIQVTNNSTATDNATTVMTLDTSALISSGYATGGTDFSIQYAGSDVAFQPSINSTIPWSIYVPSIAAESTATYSLYSNTVTDGKRRIFTDVQGMSVADSASLELGDNFTVEIKGRFNTTYTTTTENVTLRPNATGTTGDNLNRNTGAANYECVDEAIADNNTSYVYTNDIITGKADTYNLQNPTQGANSYITNVRVYARALTTDVDGAGDGWIKVGLRSGASDAWGAPQPLTLVYADYYKDYTASPFTSNNWTWAEITTLEAGVWLEASIDPPGVAAGDARCTQVWIIVSYENRKYAAVKDGAFYVELTADDEITATANTTSSVATPVTTTEKTVAVKGYTTSETYSQTSGTNSGVIRAGGNTRYGERLTSFPLNVTTSIQFRLFRVGSPTGTANITMRKVSDDSLIGTIGTKDVSTLTTEVTGERYAFTTSPITNSTYEDVRILVEYNGGDGSNYVGIIYQASDAYANGQLTYYNAGYSDVSGLDARFTVILTEVKKFGTYIDDVAIDTDYLQSSVPNNASTWYFCQNGIMDYTEHIKIWVGGVLKGHWVPEYAETLTDQSGNSNTATPTYRTTSSDADISASLVNFAPTSQSELDTITLVSEYSILTGSLTTPTDMYDDSDYSRLPVAWINELLGEGGVPEAAWWFPFLFLMIGIIGMTVYGATTTTRGFNGRIQEGQIDGSLFLMGLVIWALLIAFWKLGPLPGWPVFLWLLPWMAITFSRKHLSWG